MKNTATGIRRLFEDYSRRPVPTEKTVSGLRVGLIIVGINIAIPAFLVGIELGHTLGILRTAGAAQIGGLILLLVASATGIVAARTHLSTYVLLQYAFGRKGASMISFLVGITLLCWFSVSAILFAKGVQSGVAALFGVDHGTQLYLIAGSILMASTTIFGFKALDKISLFFVPLMLVFLFFVLAKSIENASWENIVGYSSQGMTFGNAISAVVGGFIVGAILFPDICRYVRRQIDAVIGASIGFLIGYPVILCLFAIVGISSGQRDFIQVLFSLGLGTGGLILLILATWTTNASNLYSSSLAFAALFRATEKWKLVIVAAIIGTVLATFNIDESLVPFLLLLGIAIPPIAGILVTDFFVFARGEYDWKAAEHVESFNYPAFAAWATGSFAGFFSTNTFFTLTGIAALDSIVVASLMYISVRHLSKARVISAPDQSEKR